MEMWAELLPVQCCCREGEVGFVPSHQSLDYERRHYRGQDVPTSTSYHYNQIACNLRHTRPSFSFTSMNAEFIKDAMITQADAFISPPKEFFTSSVSQMFIGAFDPAIITNPEKFCL